MRRPNLTREELAKRLSYDPLTGLFTWLQPPKEHARMRGKVAGCKTTGYVMIRLDSIKYKAHHLAWLYVFGEWPTQEIDHRDVDPFNNRIANLRLASNPQNQANRRRNAGKTTPKGVRALPSGRFNARLRVEGHLITVGTFDTEAEASNAYLAAARRHYGEFARAD